MLRTVATLLLMMQLRPFAGAAICLHESLTTHPGCEMTMPGTSNHRGAAQHSSSVPAPKPSSDCPLAQLCANPAGAVLSVSVSTTVAPIEQPSGTPSYQNTLHTTDPAAPLVPPPNN
ncbi:MAG: hypothetical protein ABUL71_01455 [Gemmatimonadota bacterium]